MNRIIKIGHGEKGQEIIIPELEKENNIVIGFGVDANKKRVYSIYFYYLNRIRYYDIRYYKKHQKKYAWNIWKI